MGMRGGDSRRRSGSFDGSRMAGIHNLPPYGARRPARASWDVIMCHVFIMGPIPTPAVCAGPRVVCKVSRPACRPVVPDAPLPEPCPSPAHNARPAVRASACARRRAGLLPKCRGMSCGIPSGPLQCVMKCHDLNAHGAYAVVLSGMKPRFRVFRVVSPASSFRHGFLLPVRRRSVSAAGPPGQRDPDSRVSSAGACARAGARFAAARLVRLIARARRRAHLSHAFLRGFFAPARTGKSRRLPGRLLLPRTLSRDKFRRCQ